MLRVGVLVLALAVAADGSNSHSHSKSGSFSHSHGKGTHSHSGSKSKSGSHSHSHSKGKGPPKPGPWLFNCDSNCVECTGLETLPDGRQRVTVDTTGCKKTCLHWFCARNDGAEAEECHGRCGRRRTKSHSHSHSHSHSFSFSLSLSLSFSHSGGGGNGGLGLSLSLSHSFSHSHSHSHGGGRGKGPKPKKPKVSGPSCRGATGGTFVLPAADTTLVLQAHDRRQEGNFRCNKPNKEECCGPCGRSGCCNHVVELSTCPTMPPPSPPCPACGTNAATVKTIAPDGMTVAHDAPPRFPLENFMSAWTSCDEQIYIYDCLAPAPTRGFFPEQNHGIPEDSTLEITCPCNADDSPCEVIVSQYHCPGCSTSTNGGFPTVLPPLGWRAGSCAPFMSTTQSWDTAEQWRMLAFRKLVAAGTTEQIPVTGSPAEHVAVFVRQCAIDCATVDPMAGAPDECVCTGMEIGDCHSAWCPTRTGPPVIAPVPCAMDPRCAPTCALAMMP